MPKAIRSITSIIIRKLKINSMINQLLRFKMITYHPSIGQVYLQIQWMLFQVIEIININ